MYYQTIQAVDRSVPQRANVNESLGAGIKLLQKAAQALNGWSVSWRVNKELEALKPQIERTMPPRGGVLVCVGIQQWDRPDSAGGRAQSFLSIHIVAGGADPGALLRQYLSRDRLTVGASRGWVRKDVFIWVTK